MLDGFDEMGYVGNKEYRLKHFESLWQLAKPGSKIIIAGRPSYFFSEGELNKALQAINEDDIISVEKPHCRLVKLGYLSSEEIFYYVSKYYDGKEGKEYFKFLQKNRHLFELASRPSLMHIIREMLPEIYQNFKCETFSNKRRYTAGYLMKKYTKHWITRQSDKKIKGGLTDDDKESFFIKLSEYLYLNRTEIVTPDIINKLMEKFLPNVDISDPEKKDGILGDILSGSFLQRQVTNSYKFVHRSFYEFFVAQQIVKYIKEENKYIPELIVTYWREEVTSFVSDLLDKGYQALPAHIDNNQYFIRACNIFKELAEIEFIRNTEKHTSKSFINNLFFNLSLNVNLLKLKSKFINLSKLSLKTIDGNKFNILKIPYIKKLYNILKYEDFIIFALSLVMSGIFLSSYLQSSNNIVIISRIKNKFLSHPLFSLLLALVMVGLSLVLIIMKTNDSYRNKSSLESEDILKLFKTALTNKTNVCFYRGDSTKEFIDDRLFSILLSNLFTKSGALSNHNFSNWRLIGKNETSIDLSEADLRGACFRNAIINNVSFKKSKLNNADFEGAELKNVDIEDSEMDAVKGFSIDEADKEKSNEAGIRGVLVKY